MATVWLFEYGTSRPYAFSSDDEKAWFTRNGKAWAFASGEWLFSYETRRPIGFFSGGFLFDATTRKPLYFKGT